MNSAYGAIQYAKEKRLGTKALYWCTKLACDNTLKKYGMESIHVYLPGIHANVTALYLCTKLARMVGNGILNAATLANTASNDKSTVGAFQSRQILPPKKTSVKSLREQGHNA